MTIKKTLTVLVSAVSIIWLGSYQLSASGDIKTVTLVQDSDYPPFMIAEHAGPAGIYADIVRAADERLPGYNILLTASPWPRAKFLVETGRANGLVGTYHKPVRRPWIRHFSTPLATETIYVYCRDGVAKETWNYPQDYAGLLFTNNAGFATPGTEFFELVEQGKIEVIEEQTTDENLRLLHIGRADCYVQEQVAVEISLRLNKFHNIKPIRKVLKEPAHIGYSEHWSASDGDAFIQEMDQVLEEMAQDGTISDIIMKWTDGTI
ncbi:substrate-binding periplasmic protein [Roseibium sp.]|uniref:substrate-binding periplasmic protein n=1 Tax=Roseibium sp. TaxID=1936156 RepID=UPI003B5176B8